MMYEYFLYPLHIESIKDYFLKLLLEYLKYGLNYYRQFKTNNLPWSTVSVESAGK